MRHETMKTLTKDKDFRLFKVDKLIVCLLENCQLFYCKSVRLRIRESETGVMPKKLAIKCCGTRWKIS